MEEKKELTKEQLESIAHNLSEQGRKLFDENTKLKKLVEEMNMANLFKRLDYLFRIINEDNKFISESFKEKCAEEIEFIMTQVPEETTEETIE